MTSANARTVANVVLVSAGAAAAVVVITTPSLRRLAARGIRMWLGMSVPAYLMHEVMASWAEAGRGLPPDRERSLP